jgi:hypothetical protein
MVIGFILLATATSLYSQEDMRVVDNSVFESTTRPPALFEHDAHNEAAGIEECSVCHHVYEEGVLMEDESSEDQRCSECHQRDPDARLQPLMRKFHQGCKGCHIERKKGPIMCGQCHKTMDKAAAD